MTIEPIRLLDGLEASASERALLEAGRDAPVAYDLTAGAARLRASLAASAGLAGVATATARRGAAKVLFAKLASKLLLALAVGVPLAGAAYVGARLAVPRGAAIPALVVPSAAAAAAPSPTVVPEPLPTDRGASPAAIAPEPAGVRASPAPVTGSHAGEASRAAAGRRAPRSHDAPERAAPGDAVLDPDGILGSRGARPAPSPASAVPATSASPATPASAASAASPASAAPGPAVAAVPPIVPPHPLTTTSQPPASDSLGELRAIAQARELVDRDPEAALGVLAQVRREHPNGYFVEERQALTVLALARAGRTDEARRSAGVFLRVYPNGPLSDRVRAVAAH